MLLTDGEELQRTVLNAPMGICILNMDTVIAEVVNDKFLEVADKPYEVIQGSPNCRQTAKAHFFHSVE